MCDHNSTITLSKRPAWTVQAVANILQCKSRTLHLATGKYQPFSCVHDQCSLAYLKALRVAGHGSEQREGGHMGGGLYLVSFEGFSKGALPNLLDVG